MDSFAEPTGYTARIAGFFLYVSNTTVNKHWHICFHDIQRVNEHHQRTNESTALFTDVMLYTITNVLGMLFILVIIRNSLTTNYVSWKFMVSLQ